MMWSGIHPLSTEAQSSHTDMRTKLRGHVKRGSRLVCDIHGFPLRFRIGDNDVTCMGDKTHVCTLGCDPEENARVIALLEDSMSKSSTTPVLESKEFTDFLTMISPHVLKHTPSASSVAKKGHSCNEELVEPKIFPKGTFRGAILEEIWKILKVQASWKSAILMVEVFDAFGLSPDNEVWRELKSDDLIEILSSDQLKKLPKGAVSKLMEKF
jgi:hypothetical protein